MRITTALGSRIIKVNHAGERGAISIYSGQLATSFFSAPSMREELLEFREHERRHLKIFGDELRNRNVPRCKSFWLCGIGGYFLGAITGLLGRNAIAATTFAVERVVLRHLSHQLEVIDVNDDSARSAISEIIQDEINHHDSALAKIDPGHFWPKIITAVVDRSTEAIIWLGMRL